MTCLDKITKLPTLINILKIHFYQETSQMNSWSLFGHLLVIYIQSDNERTCSDKITKLPTLINISKKHFIYVIATLHI